MKVRAIAPEDLARITAEDWVDPTRRPQVHDGIAYVPVREGFAFDDDLPERVQYHGRGFFMLGDVAVIHGSAPLPEEIDRIVALKKPRGIILIRSVRDPTRRPVCDILYGEAGEVRHKENGYWYTLDPTLVMFSQGNLNEKRRMAALVRSGNGEERIADMYAGVGYFTIPVAGAGANVHAIEINPPAFNYLEKNIAINGLAGRVEASLGDCRDHLKGTYDRIIMGHFDAIGAFPQALTHVTTGSAIHLHSIGTVEDEIRSCLQGAGFSADLHVHKVKKYSPHAWHIVQDIVIL